MTVRLVAALNRVRHDSRPGCYTRDCQCEAMRLVKSESPPVPVTNIASLKDGAVQFESCLHPHVAVHEVNTQHNCMPCEPEVIAMHLKSPTGPSSDAPS